MAIIKKGHVDRISMDLKNTTIVERHRKYLPKHIGFTKAVFTGSGSFRVLVSAPVLEGTTDDGANGTLLLLNFLVTFCDCIVDSSSDSWVVSFLFLVTGD